MHDFCSIFKVLTKNPNFIFIVFCLFKFCVLKLNIRRNCIILIWRGYAFVVSDLIDVYRLVERFWAIKKKCVLWILDILHDIYLMRFLLRGDLWFIGLIRFILPFLSHNSFFKISFEKPFLFRSFVDIYFLYKFWTLFSIDQLLFSKGPPFLLYDIFIYSTIIDQIKTR